MARICFSLMMLLALSGYASAQVRLYMEDFTISENEEKEVALLLSNGQEATALEAHIALPAGLQYVDGSVAKTSRVKGRGAEVKASVATGKLVVVETDGTIAAGEGAVITLKVKDTGLAEGPHTISLSGLVVSDANGEQLNGEEANTASVTMLGLGYCNFTLPETIEVAVGEEYQVDVTLNNESVNNLAGLQGKLWLPAGLEIVEGEDGLFVYSDRIPAKSEFKFKAYDDYVSFVLSSSSNYIISGTEGVIFSFKVKATKDFAEEAVIKLTELYVATTTGKSQLCNQEITIVVTNTTAKQLKADKAAFEEYKTQQKSAADALAQEGDSEDCLTLIAEAKAAIDALAYDEAKTLDENKYSVDALLEKLAADLAAQRVTDSIGQVVTGANAGRAYNANGVLIGRNHKGITIVRMTNGSVQKRYVK